MVTDHFNPLLTDMHLFYRGLYRVTESSSIYGQKIYDLTMFTLLRMQVSTFVVEGNMRVTMINMFYIE